MRQVEDAHHPVDQAEPSGDQKKHGAIQQRIEDVNEQPGHANVSLSIISGTRP